MEAAGLISADQETSVPKRPDSHRDRKPFVVYSFLQPLAGRPTCSPAIDGFGDCCPPPLPGKKMCSKMPPMDGGTSP